MTKPDTNIVEEIKKEASDLRKPQVHDREWFKRVDRILYRISLLEDISHAN